MVNHLFAGFCSDLDQYHNAKQYWINLCREVIQQHSEAQDWRPWLNTYFSDGSLMEPGNPIHDLRSEALRKSIRIIQVPPTTDQISFSTWHEKVEDDPAEGMDRDELVIHCELSDEAADEARRVLADWVKSRGRKGDRHQNWAL